MASKNISAFRNATVALETFTPEDAARALKKSRVNRNFRDDVAAKYVADMEMDNWGMTESAVAFDVKGYLVNGYHRLTAQVRTGKTVTWCVLRNVPLGAQDDFDQGIPRTLSDILGYKGVTHPQLAGAVLKLVANILDNGMTRARSKLSLQQLMDVYDNYPEIKTSVEVAHATRKDSATPIAPSVLGAGHWMISEVNGIKDATDFIERVSNMVGEVSGSPVIALSKRINEAKRNRVRISQRDGLAVLLKAYNYDVEGKSLRAISLFPKTSKVAEWELPEVRRRRRK